MISNRRFCTEVFDALPRCKEESREGGRCRSGRDGRKGGVVYILSGGWCTISNAFFVLFFRCNAPKSDQTSHCPVGVVLALNGGGAGTT